MDTTSSYVAGPVEVVEAIVDDLPCRQCGYNLRGLLKIGLCPECGSPVELSTRGDLLRYADPNWVETLARGLRFILWGMLFAVVVGGLSALVVIMVNPLIGQFFASLGSLLVFYGSWLLTVPDPSQVGEDAYGTARKVIRVCVVFGLVNSIVSTLVTAMHLAGLLFWLVTAATVALGLVAQVGEIFKYLYLERLAGRIPDPTLAKSAWQLRWVYLVGMIVVGVSMAALILAAAESGMLSGAAGGAAAGAGPFRFAIPTPGGGGGANPFGTPAGGLIMAFGCVVLIAGLLLSVANLYAIYFQYRFSKVLREQAWIGRTAWAAAIPPAS